MIYGAQKVAKALGDSGCYFLSIGKVCEELGSLYLDIMLEATSAMRNGSLSPDCFVLDASRIISSILRSPWSVLKAGPGHELSLEYALEPGEREILRFERTDEKGVLVAHFVVGDGHQGVAWDPWPGSLTAAKGVLVSRRIIRRAQ
jgi:hypothetical protein